MATIGAILKAERRAAGGNLAALALRSGLSRPYLSNIENGVKPPTRQVVLAYGLEYPNMLSRREIIAYLATSAAAGPAALAFDLEQALAASIPVAHSPDDWAEVHRAHSRSFMALPEVPQVRMRLWSDLSAIRGTTSTRKVHALTGRMTTLYGQTWRELDGPDAAVDWYRRGVAWADTSGDPATQVWSRARAAQDLEDQPLHVGLARTWANEAVAIADRPTTGLVLAHLTRAVLVARSNADVLAELDAADRALARTGCDTAATDEDIPWWRHAVTRAGILAGIAHPGAEAAIDQAARALPAGHARYSTHLELHRAVLEHARGDHASALQRAQQAVESLSADRRSQSVRRLVVELTGDRGARPVVLKRFR
ncbi:hypothetical protein Lfu02_01020 [Longispora fulva]|uniref:Transcriptional regulator with XRE-family HTH domain n=1 Tax=Longispora fulva TaxID=619741 RepID=A0A8J7GH19_9ACTN|nr:helix-turn-helix domain-containing protein [Longispora fulva]MBG6136028.1 transcriptional regulator with XRE-family HTH domain [Longispora fulva]GIG55730.1 hypothetical protein Lfu02_01020 [Longispora fulva]